MARRGVPADPPPAPERFRGIDGRCLLSYQKTGGAPPMGTEQGVKTIQPETDGERAQAVEGENQTDCQSIPGGRRRTNQGHYGTRVSRVCI